MTIYGTRVSAHALTGSNDAQVSARDQHMMRQSSRGTAHVRKDTSHAAHALCHSTSWPRITTMQPASHS